MQLPHLSISTTKADIGMKSHRPPLQINQKPADLSIKQDNADLQMKRSPGKLMIDQSEAFADAGLKGPLRRSKENFEESKQQVLEYLAKTARQGDQMMRIDQGGNAISHLAKENGNSHPKETTMGWVPKNAFRVKFDYQPEKLDINVQVHEPEINVQKNEPVITFKKWQSDVYVKQKQSISIQAVGVNVNRQL